MTSRPFESFVAPARARPQLWRLALGLLLSLAVYVLWIALVFGAIWFLTGFSGDPAWLEALMAAATPTDLLLLLVTFLGMAFGPMLAARWLHGRRAGTLFGPAPRVLRDFVIAAGITGAALAVSVSVWLISNDPEPNIAPSTWLAVLPLAVLGLLVQTGAEELVFRGYLQQQLAARFRSALVWMILPAALFGLVHYDPITAGDNTWLVVGSAAVFGLVAADLTACTGSLGAAWGFHFANNAFALLLIGTKGQLTGLALYLTPYEIDAASLAPLILVDLAVMLAIWFVLRRILAR